jgi:hypothetical protein
MSAKLRPLKVEETQDCFGLKYDLDSEIYHKKVNYDVVVWWVADDDHSTDDEQAGWTYICVPHQSVLEMLSLHFDMNYVEALSITGADVLSIDEDLERVKELLAAIRIAEPTDYLAVVRYIKETPQQPLNSEGVVSVTQSQNEGPARPGLYEP